MLNQVIYWSDRTDDPDGWFWKTYADWYEEIGLTEREIRRIVRGDKRRKTPKKTLQNLGIEVAVRRAPTGSPTMHYRINQPLFFAILVDHLERNHDFVLDKNQPASGQTGNKAKGGLETDHCAARRRSPSLKDSKITSIDSQIESSVVTEEDDDIGIQSKQKKQFGKMNSRLKTSIQQQLARLGREKVHEVIDRCIAKGGKSWFYVLKALENEPDTTEKPADNKPRDFRTSEYADFIRFGDEGEDTIEQQDARIRAYEQARQRRINAPIQPTARVKTPWKTPEGTQTVQEAWNVTCSRMERILDRTAFDTLVRGATLTDFDPVTKTFIVVLGNLQAYNKRYQIHFNTIYRILLTVFGDPKADVRFLTRADWLLRSKTIPTDQQARRSA